MNEIQEILTAFLTGFVKGTIFTIIFYCGLKTIAIIKGGK